MVRKKSIAAKARAAEAANVARQGDGGVPITSVASSKRPTSPLVSTSHTLQLLIALGLQPLLLLVACLLVPQGVMRTGGATDTSLMSLTQGVKRLLDGELGDLRGKMGLALQGSALVQVWFAMRIRSWYNAAQALEEGDAEGFKVAQGVGFWDQLEHVTSSLMNVAFGIIAVYILLVVGGAPVVSAPLSTVTLSTYIVLLGLLPALNTYGSPLKLGFSESTPVQLSANDTWWISTLATGSPRTPRDAVALFQLAGTFMGAWLGAAGMALDWGRPWQIYPVPNMLAALAGLSIGNGAAALYYLFS